MSLVLSPTDDEGTWCQIVNVCLKLGSAIFGLGAESGIDCTRGAPRSLEKGISFIGRGGPDVTVSESIDQFKNIVAQQRVDVLLLTFLSSFEDARGLFLNT